MSVRPGNLPPIQDMPPAGGFPKIDHVRKFPTRGPTGWQIWLGATLAITYGFIQVGRTNRERAVQRMEERKLRYAIAPFLQAEADLEYIAREKQLLKREAEVMKDVPNWQAGKSPYISKVWMPRMNKMSQKVS
mmetsp:Transcript_17372/g.29460  ORF Transcript_17372/g.29460 Transcript_17372/m.29460 type:complete len:133 (+) Transcript_17372:208-606(+)